jgi:hypothetical protein
VSEVAIFGRLPAVSGLTEGHQLLGRTGEPMELTTLGKGGRFADDDIVGVAVVEVCGGIARLHAVHEEAMERAFDGGPSGLPGPQEATLTDGGVPASNRRAQQGPTAGSSSMNTATSSSSEQ